LPAHQQLADALRDARAQAEAGWPICPSCHDGKDIRFEPPSRVGDPEIRRYRCMCCVRRFSDLHGTPLEGTRSPLRTWALVLLSGSLDTSERALGVLTGVERHHLRAMAAKLKGTLTAQLWGGTLHSAGITAESIIGSYPVERRQAFTALSTSLQSACQPTRKRPAR
jgi:transposase-like protein